MPEYFNFATQTMYHTESMKKLADASPLSNYKEVDWEKLYLDADLDLYFAQEKLKTISTVLFPKKTSTDPCP